MINVHNLYKKYKDATDFSVKDLSLHIQKQEVFGILGPNGAGKTTLISMLCGLINPTTGQIKIEGKEFKQDATALKQIMGVVPQEYALYETLTARENLMFFGAMYGLKKEALKILISEHLEILGLSTVADKKIATFSGGMKRRINLIAGVMHKPKILFLDEPTVGVDVQSRQAIMTFLKQLNKEGTTIIYTSHHLSEAEDFCTQIAIIDHGALFALGNPQQLIMDTAGANHLEDVFLSLTGYKMRDNV